MKNSIKYLAGAALAILVSFSANSTYAQRGGRGGGGGGGSHGGGGFHSSGGGSFGGRSGGVVGHSGGSFNGGNRGSFQGGQRQPQVNNSPRVNQGSQSYNRDSRAYSSQTYRGGQRAYSNSPRGGFYSNGRGYTGRAGVYYHGGYRSTYRNFYGGYYNRLYAPHIGFRLNVLPYGYYPFYWGDDQFYYNNGLFYQQYDNTQYEVVAPPMGAIVPTVPNDAKSITIDGLEYYELNGIYYQPVTTSDGTTGYKIVGKDGELNTDHGNDDVYPQDNNNNNPQN
ncbi:MAG: DUF6515 family protein [Mucilaginibacter sp.]|uniref:DUF6515 family protein n=1 Tax=Mucilaginibacter sp. TaxID=1882438 RepID=UPI0032640FAB